MIAGLINYLHYGFGRFKEKLWLAVLRLVGPRWTATIYGYLFRRLARGLDPSKKTVFTYRRQQWTRDLDELQRRTGFNFIVVDIEDLFFITDAFIPKTYGGQVNFNEDQSEECRPYKELIVDLFERLFRVLGGAIKIDFILSANFDCSYDYGMTFAGKRLGIRSYVFYYEHPTIPYARSWWISQFNYYNVKLYADKLAVWGDLARPCVIDTGLCPASQVVVTGAPRFDRWRDFDPDSPPLNYVVLQAYPGLEYFALCNFIDVIRIFARLSVDHPDHTFWVKCKNPGQTFLAMSYLDGLPHHRLKVSDTFDLVAIQARAKVIVGFNSLSILESMLSNAQLITPCWGDSDLAPYLLQCDPRDELTRRVYHFPPSREECKALVERFIRTSPEEILTMGKRDRSARDELLARYVFRDPNVSSSELIARMMETP